MLDQRCPTPIQRKLADYLHRGGRLIAAGRMCVADEDGQPCTTLKEALRVESVASDPPFTPSAIRAFGYPHVPASFVETYTGQFDEVFAMRGDDEAVGFVQSAGAGRAVWLGAAMPLYLLEDLDILHRMALKADCPPAFTVSNWVDVRLSRGANGSFLFINNYQDDPVETTLAHHGAAVLGGRPAHLPARQGLILPLDWRVRPGVLLHYATAEITGVAETEGALVLTTSQPAFTAELTLAGWQCDDAVTLADSAAGRRIEVRGQAGQIVLQDDGHRLRE
jgi:beta-galactosidase